MSGWGALVFEPADWDDGLVKLFSCDTKSVPNTKAFSVAHEGGAGTQAGAKKGKENQPFVIATSVSSS